MEIDKMQFRQEIKFICDLELASGLEGFFKRRGFVKSYPNRRVTSVYYDTIDFKCARDNLAGSSPRQKYRLRWYSSNECKFFDLNFETKIKVGSLGTKKREALNHISLQQLSSGKELLLDKKFRIDNGFIFPTAIEPKLVVSYERSYLALQEGVRMTVDSNLRFKSYSLKNLQKFLAFDRGGPPLGDSSTRIIELKWEADRPSSMSSLLRDLPSPATRCSKYLLGLSRTQGLSYL